MYTYIVILPDFIYKMQIIEIEIGHLNLLTLKCQILPDYYWGQWLSGIHLTFEGHH